MKRIAVRRSRDTSPEQKVLAIMYGSRRKEQAIGRSSDVLPYWSSETQCHYAFAEEAEAGGLAPVSDFITDVVVLDRILADDHIIVGRRGNQVVMYEVVKKITSPCKSMVLFIGREVGYAA